MPYTSIHRGARISPTKARPVARMIAGKTVFDAMNILSLSKKRAAVMIKNCLQSARANAQERDGLTDRQALSLIVTEARVDGGMTIKRYQPKDRGRAHQILKRTSHITVTVDEKKR
ncbi:MAG: 50S ribosomal protein L22 [Phycisphaeraceae bacterium]